jgi:hypothetical protein
MRPVSSGETGSDERRDARPAVTALVMRLPDGQQVMFRNEYWNRSGVPGGRAWRNYRNGKSRPIKLILADILAGIMTPDAERLKRHLERQFTAGMNWDNYGTYWTIDHLIPAGWFNLNRLIDRKLFNSFANLRPMPAHLNFARGAAMTLGDVPRFVYWSSKIAGSEAPGCVRSFHQPGVTFIPIQPEPPPLDLVAARPNGEPPPTVAAFLDLLRQQLPRIRSKYACRRTRIRTEGKT